MEAKYNTPTFKKNIAEALGLVDGGFLNEPYVATATIDNAQGFVRLETTQQEPNKIV